MENHEFQNHNGMPVHFHIGKNREIQIDFGLYIDIFLKCDNP